MATEDRNGCLHGDDDGKFVSKGDNSKAYNSQENKVVSLVRKINNKKNIETKKQARDYSVNDSKTEDLIKKYSSDPGKESVRRDRTIRHLEKRINEHKDKILNPEKYIIDWDKRSEAYKNGIKNYWKKEIINFYNQINRIRG